MLSVGCGEGAIAELSPFHGGKARGQKHAPPAGLRLSPGTNFALMTECARRATESAGGSSKMRQRARACAVSPPTRGAPPNPGSSPGTALTSVTAVTTRTDAERRARRKTQEVETAAAGQFAPAAGHRLLYSCPAEPDESADNRQQRSSLSSSPHPARSAGRQQQSHLRGPAIDVSRTSLSEQQRRHDQEEAEAMKAYRMLAPFRGDLGRPPKTNPRQPGLSAASRSLETPGPMSPLRRRSR